MGAGGEADDDAGPVAAVARALRYADKLRIGDLAHSVDEERVGFAREVLARAAVVALRDAGYHLPRRPSEPGDARPDPDMPNDLTAREHLRAAVAFALGRVPRSWLRRMWADRNTDDVRALVAARVVEQVELSNIRYAPGPPSNFAQQQFGTHKPGLHE